jgi:hypothetical protein
VADHRLDMASRESPAYKSFVDSARSLARRKVVRHSASQSDTVRGASLTGSPRRTRSRTAGTLALASAWVRP